MKKFLSLVLALVMAMSLVTVSAGAKDFNDSEKLSGEVYEEAVNVMSEMGIIDGYADGSFQPQGTLTRGAAAKIIACMMLGKTTAESLGTQAAPFKDVPVGSTFAGYIAYCSESGIIDGYSDGTFRPANTLTGFAFLKMLLTALGYDSAIEGYANNPNWTVNVAGRAKQIGLLDGNDAFVGTRAATREEACLYAVNALQATLVEYTDKGQSITINGATISTGASNATYVTSNVYDQATSIDSTTDNGTIWTVEFAEKYQPDLALKDATDAFGRPAHTWTWKNTKVGTYVDYDKMVAEYTTKVTGEDLYNLLGRTALDECEVYTYVDGETERDVLVDAYFTRNQMAKNYDDAIGETGNGVLTQVFHDTRNDEITVAVINTYLAKAQEDYDEKNDELDLKVYSVSDAGHRSQYVKDTDVESDMTVSGEDFDIAEVKDGDLYLVTIADGEIQTMAAPEVLAGSTVTSFRVDKYVISGGTQYDFSDTARYDVDTLYNWTGISAESNLKNLTYDIILDPYGYAIGVKLVEEPNQYLFLTGVDINNSNLAARTADANVIFTDGKMDTVTVNLRNSRGLNVDGTVNTTNNTLLGSLASNSQANVWCTYTVDSNGVYTLRMVATSAVNNPKVMQASQDVGAGNEVEINKGHVALNGVGAAGNVYARVYGNDDTIYINVDNNTDLLNINDAAGHPTTIIDDVDSVTTGVRNVDLSIVDLTDVEDTHGVDIWNVPPTDEIYTLHDKDGYIIAVVTIGEDQGTTTNYAYITGGVKQETYGADKDEWSWLRPAIVNGKAVELREVGDGLNLLDGLTVGAWYEIRYDADGNVRKVTGPITFPAYVTGNEFIGNVNDIQTAIDDNVDTLLAFLDYCDLEDRGEIGFGAGSEVNLSFKGNTLFIDTLGAAPRGFSVSPNVNVVLCLADRDHSPFDDIDDSYTGTAGLEKALRNLDTAATDVNNDGMLDYTFNGHLSFIMEDGVITSIVLNDYTGPRANRFDATQPAVAITPDDPAVVDGANVVLTANVGNAAACYKLTYQWYLSTDNGAHFTTIAGATGATYTVGTVTTAMNGYQYKCEVTNTDERNSVTGDTVMTGVDTVTLTVSPASMSVQTRYELANGTKVKTTNIVPVSPTGNNNYVIIATEGDTFVEDGVVYEVVDTVAVPFAANTFANATVEVEILGAAAAAVNAPEDLVLTWAPAMATTADGIDYYAVGATATVAVKAGVGKWDSTATNDVTSETVTIDASGKVQNMPTAAEFGYFKISGYTADVGGWTVTGPDAVKPDEDITIQVSFPGGGWNVGDYRGFVLSGAITAAKVIVDAPANGTDPVSVVYSGAVINSDGTVNVTVSNETSLG